MPIDPDVAVGATRPEIAVLLDRVRRAALPPRRRRGRGPGGQRRSGRHCAGRSRATGCRCCRRSASSPPTFHVTDRRHRTCPAATSTCPRCVHGTQAIEVARPDPDQRLGHGHDTDHRRLGQGQGGRDLAGGRRHLCRRHRRSGRPARRSSCAARAAGAATAGRPRPVEVPDRDARPRHVVRTHTAAGAALPALRRPQPAALRPGASRRRPASRRRSCTACAPTASCSAWSSTACSTATQRTCAGLHGAVRRRRLPGRDDPGACAGRPTGDVRRRSHRRGDGRARRRARCWRTA